MDKIKRLVLCHIPTSICNFRCHYCYISQRAISYQGEQAKFEYSPEHVGKAFSLERLGGACFFNFCADGETLLTKRIDEYIKAIVMQGHYAEIVTNMVITPIIEKILAWDKELLKHVEFKCSFHYLELLKQNLLNSFADNVNKAWKAGASTSIEITPSDELIPYINDVMKFSLKNFGALPQLTIARNDATDNIEYLTKLSPNEYEQTWAVFDSQFWQFKRTIFGVKRNEFCHAGVNAIFVDLATGVTKQCYVSRLQQNIFKNLSKPIKFTPIGKCTQPHCYNGHALLTFGCVYGKFEDIKYGDNIRNRIRNDGSHWIQPQMLEFMNGRTEESNVAICLEDKMLMMIGETIHITKANLRKCKHRM